MRAEIRNILSGKKRYHRKFGKRALVAALLRVTENPDTNPLLVYKAVRLAMMINGGAEAARIIAMKEISESNLDLLGLSHLKDQKDED